MSEGLRPESVMSLCPSALRIRMGNANDGEDKHQTSQKALMKLPSKQVNRSTASSACSSKLKAQSTASSIVRILN